jgi:hypothetical protein
VGSSGQGGDVCTVQEEVMDLTGEEGKNCSMITFLIMDSSLVSLTPCLPLDLGFDFDVQYYFGIWASNVREAH